MGSTLKGKNLFTSLKRVLSSKKKKEKKKKKKKSLLPSLKRVLL